MVFIIISKLLHLVNTCESGARKVLSVYWLHYRLDNHGIMVLFLAQHFLFSKVSYLGGKVDHSPASRAKVKNEWNYTSTPPYTFMMCMGQYYLWVISSPKYYFNTFAASYLNTQGLNNSCLKSPASTLVDLTFQSRTLLSFSLNQLRNLSL